MESCEGAGDAKDLEEVSVDGEMVALSDVGAVVEARGEGGGVD